jgi:hypothetical protein
MLPQQPNRCIQLGLRNVGSTREDDGRSGLDLVIIEFTKVLHIELYLAGISNCHLIIHHHVVTGDFLHSSNHIA